MTKYRRVAKVTTDEEKIVFWKKKCKGSHFMPGSIAAAGCSGKDVCSGWIDFAERECR